MFLLSLQCQGQFMSEQLRPIEQMLFPAPQRLVAPLMSGFFPNSFIAAAMSLGMA
jgi:hypothetical protein